MQSLARMERAWRTVAQLNDQVRASISLGPTAQPSNMPWHTSGTPVWPDNDAAPKKYAASVASGSTTATGATTVGTAASSSSTWETAEPWERFTSRETLKKMWKEAVMPMMAYSAVGICGQHTQPKMKVLEEKEEAEYCEACEMWLNGPSQMEDHKVGKKHKKNLAGVPVKLKKNKGIVAPAGTVLLIEQSALYADAVQHYMLSLYKRSAFRSRM